MQGAVLQCCPSNLFLLATLWSNQNVLDVVDKRAMEMQIKLKLSVDLNVLHHIKEHLNCSHNIKECFNCSTTQRTALKLKVLRHLKLSEKAFKLFDADGDGLISAEELSSLIKKVGGEMADAEAKALINAADKDGNQGIDFGEFAKGGPSWGE